MGCDIHAYIETVRHEVRGDGTPNTYVRPFTGRISLGRNYELFGLMAGVRTEGPPVVPPRGIPKDLSDDAEEDYLLLVADSDETGTCTAEQAAKWIASGSSVDWKTYSTYRWITHPDWHTPSWLTTEELEEVQRRYVAEGRVHTPSQNLAAVIATMKALDSDSQKARLVFWFDN